MIGKDIINEFFKTVLSTNLNEASDKIIKKNPKIKTKIFF